MEFIINSSSGRVPVWDHFLLKDTEVSISYTDDTNRTTQDKLLRNGDEYRWELKDRIVEFELTINSVFIYKGISYQVLKIIQRFNVLKTDNRATGIVPIRWQKLIPDQAIGFAKAIPSLHPLLRLNTGIVTVTINFVDITRLFNDIHGDTPWYMALELLKGTPRKIRVLASLQGHPFIWYVVIPDSAGGQSELQPNVLYYPADYGGISYSSSLDGITSANHNTSVNNIQCGGETLFSFLTNPLLDSDYSLKLEKYLALTERFKKRIGRNPPPLHHFREVLSYNPTGGILEPRYWDIPFGFEQAISDRKQILIIPQINGGDGGIAIKSGLKNLVEDALMLIYTQGNTLHYETINVNKLILTCYSESGGNVFTASKNNLSDIKAIICFEAQYMNKHLSKENTSLSLGKDVIPLLIRQRSKVIIIGRHKNGWELKYLPLKTNPAELTILPDDSHYFILEYPDPSKPYAYDASPVLTHRYSRLLKNASDSVIQTILTQETGTIDFESATQEAKVEEVIAKYRKAGFNDEKMIKEVFIPNFNVDDSGGFYTHNFIVSSGQELTADGKSVLRFFYQALTLIN